MARRSEIGSLKERIRSLRRNFECLSVGEKVLFLNAERKPFVRRQDGSLLAERNEGAGANYPLLRIESEGHRMSFDVIHKSDEAPLFPVSFACSSISRQETAGCHTLEMTRLTISGL